MYRNTGLLKAWSPYQKKVWLSEHGQATQGGYDPAQGHHVIWETNTGKKFKGVGHSIEGLDENLFRLVLDTLYLTCDNLERDRAL